ncbi:MAG: tRNA uridine-5-carboxymethylaminomethyl(34) synthesis GTPase MnmE, partial [Pseudolabrys sp.]
GPRAGAALEALSGRTPKPRQAALAIVRDGSQNPPEEIDQALVLWFPGPNSETGEDTAELQLHGGRAVIAGVLAALGKIEGLRPAEAGEFTRRAFENGKLDLTKVEGLADLVMAETQAQRRQALRQLKGLLGDRAEHWRQRLIAALALVEARIDFSDQDVPEDLLSPALAIVRELFNEIGAVLAQGNRGERLREGMIVAIAGPPNSGKSTLLNRLARREAAIVSPFAGTTRDVIEVHLDLDGYPVTLLDTAGIRETDDPIEMEGVRRARERAAQADLILWVVDSSDLSSASAPPSEADVWLIENKIDLVGSRNESSTIKNEPKSSNQSLTPLKGSFTTSRVQVNETKFTCNENKFISKNCLPVSAATSAGIPDLIAHLAAQAREFLGSAEPALITRARHRAQLQAAQEALHRSQQPPVAVREDLLAEELRLAAQALAKLTGRIDVEDILDVIFRDFCIGK